MFDFLKRKKPEPQTSLVNEPAMEQIEKPTQKAGFFARLQQGLSKTRSQFSESFAYLFLGKKELTPALINEIETLLLTADVGVETTQQFIQLLTEKLARQELHDTDAALICLKQEMQHLLAPCEQPLLITKQQPFVILMVGVNGSGKTTTIGKLAHYYTQQNKRIMLAAGDTFRAAATEQLQRWGERMHVPVIAQQPGADPAAVIFDAYQAAKARQMDLLLADTAGRLHTQSNLMAELQKIKRVLNKIDPKLPHEVLIVLDATLGQNALSQVKAFAHAIGLTGIVLTKLDGTAKGGIMFAIAKQLQVPIRFIGIGEGADDLQPFDSKAFVEALLGN